MNGPLDRPAAVMGRLQLPDRRASFTFTLAGIRYTAANGRVDDGRLGEFFLNRSKSGTDTAATDAAIDASIARQSGVDSDTIRRALTRNRDGSAAGPLGCA